MTNTNLRSFFTIILILTVSSCIHVEIKGAGKFRTPVEYDNRDMTYITIPKGSYGKNNKYLTRDKKDGSQIGFTYLGSCGGGVSFTGVGLPFVPWIFFNKCESDGFVVTSKINLDILGVTMQMRYNSKIYNPYSDRGFIKFRINNFTEFKKAPDKKLIIHKKRLDGTMFTKEIPFDWKIVVDTEGGL